MVVCASADSFELAFVWTMCWLSSLCTALVCCCLDREVFVEEDVYCHCWHGVQDGLDLTCGCGAGALNGHAGKRLVHVLFYAHAVSLAAVCHVEPVTAELLVFLFGWGGEARLFAGGLLQ